MCKPIHPGQLVVELRGSHGIPIRQIDIYDADALDDRFEKARMAIRLVSDQGCVDDLDRRSGQDRDAVVGLLRYGGGVVAQILEPGRGELRPLQLLQKKDIGLSRGQPGLDMVRSSAE